MLEWPPNGEEITETGAFGITAPLKKALKFAYNMRRKNLGKDIPYDGHTLGNHELACIFAPDEQLNADNQARDKRHGEIDVLDRILAIAFQLGLEQGRRGTKGSRLILRAGIQLIEREGEKQKEKRNA